jgi:hypothetical protein
VTASGAAPSPGVIVRVRGRLSLYRRPLLLGLSGAGLVIYLWLMLTVSARPGMGDLLGFDAYAYWNVDPQHPYVVPLGEHGSFTYSPVVALVAAPAHLLPFNLFFLGWEGFLLICLAWMTRRYLLAWLAFLPVSFELLAGNIHVLLALVCVLGFRYPALWSIGLLTKISPGVGLLWFAARREWRNLALALGATAALAAVSFVATPGAWSDWLAFLTTSQGSGPIPNDRLGFLVPPWWLRTAAASILVVWGARTNRRWVVPVAVLMALPVLWNNSFAILVALPRLLDRPAPGDRPVATDHG